MAAPSPDPGRRSIRSKIVVGGVFLVVVVVLMIWLAGGFHRKVDQVLPAGALAEGGTPLPAGAATAVVRSVVVPRTETAVGTVRAVHETAVASKLLAKVIEVNVTAGQPVQADEVLVRLDAADLTARAEQSAAAVRAASSVRDQARIEFNRIESLVGEGAASKIELDRVSSALATAEAELQRAEQAAAETAATRAYATIRSPIAGVVIDKRVEVGDTAAPGQVLVTLFDPTRMQLVASVRESLTRRLTVGQPIGVRIDTVDHLCTGNVSEIVPEAQTASRTFAVKVTGPCPPGVYSGMFGRLYIPLDDEAVLQVPQAAVRRVGQLELVEVVEGGRGWRRAVRIGRTFGDDVEVLSGLTAGETVVMHD